MNRLSNMNAQFAGVSEKPLTKDSLSVLDNRTGKPTL
jgi:hypothetical protein